MKKLKDWSLVIICIFLVNTSMVYGQETLDIQGKAALLIEAETGKVLFIKNGEQKLPPASITKLMTYLLVMEAIQERKTALTGKVKVSAVAASQEGSSYGLKEGEEVLLGELIQVMMIASANDATTAVAEHIGGDVKTFVEQMNTKAKELGMVNSHFVNPNGMPEKGQGNIMTAADIILLSKHLVQNYSKELLPLTDTGFYENKARNFAKENTNGLLKILPDVDGLKTGYTDAAGYCLVSTMIVKGKEEREQEYRLIGVVLGTATEEARAEESRKLLVYGESHYVKKEVIKEGEILRTLNLWNEERLPVGLKAGEGITVFGPREGLVKEQKVIMIDTPIFFLKEGEKLGELKVTFYDGTEKVIDLVSDREVRFIPFKLFVSKCWIPFTQLVYSFFA